MKTIDSIPTGKISRATRLVRTGVKVGINQLKYYGDTLVDPQNLSPPQVLGKCTRQQKMAKN